MERVSKTYIRKTNYTEIALKYNCDKYDLGYLKHYEKKFESIRNDVTKILEIGLNTGGSHLMWLEYFPNAMVYAIDNRILYEEYVTNKRTGGRLTMVDGWDDRDENRLIVFNGDQSNIEDLNNFRGECGSEFDIIIDDGGHTMRQQQTSFGFLYNDLKSNGIYVIEDLHTGSNQWVSLYGYVVIEQGDTLTLDLMKDFENNDGSILETKHITKERLLDIRERMNSCTVQVGMDSYKDYKWPTTLAFMDFE